MVGDPMEGDNASEYKIPLGSHNMSDTVQNILHLKSAVLLQKLTPC